MTEQALLFVGPARWGKLWFQYRSFSPLPWLLAMILLPEIAPPSPFLKLCCVMMILLSEGLRIWAVGYAGSVTRTRRDPVGRLVHAGPFRYVRNPLYLANIGLYVATGVLFGLGPLALLMLAYFCLQYSLIVAYEEANLERTFGESYRNYVAAISRWIPIWPGYYSSGERFDFKAALRSERTTLIAMGIVAILYFIIRS